MSVLDQILLLEQKVENAVAKISQLQAENDALRTRCAELTNALSDKTELLTHFEQDQGMIENGILKALDRLASIENSVLQAAGASSSQTTQDAQADNAANGTNADNAPQPENIGAEASPAQDGAQTPLENAAESPANGETAAVSAEAAPQENISQSGETVTAAPEAAPQPENTAQNGETAAQSGENAPQNPEQAQNPAPANGQFDIF
ncbi:MAG: cell division protein ZapB [Treponema sp.]